MLRNVSAPKKKTKVAKAAPDVEDDEDEAEGLYDDEEPDDGAGEEAESEGEDEEDPDETAETSGPAASKLKSAGKVPKEDNLSEVEDDAIDDQ